MTNRLLDIMKGFEGRRVGVVGDLMLDRYIFGRAERISQEAPVPVVRVTQKSAAPGGAANVLRNIASLGGKAIAFGVVGKDAAGTALCGELAQLYVDTDHIEKTSTRVTTEKTRVIAEHQQVVRIDDEDDSPVPDDIWSKVLERVEESMNDGAVDALILEDYAKGLLSPDRLQAVIDVARSSGVPVALDPHPSNRVPVIGAVVMTPNRAEAFALAGVAQARGESIPFEGDDGLHAVAEKLLQDWRPNALLITLGSGGMALFRPGVKPVRIPTRAREVFDVSGAGDTVIATYVMAMLGGASPEESVDLANRAAGVVVGKLGTAPIVLEELVHACHEPQDATA